MARNYSINLKDQLSANITGSAGSATYATNARLTVTNPTSGTWYYPTWTSGYTANTNYPLRANDGLRYYSLQGTTSATGRTILQIGNSTASGTAGNKYGEIWLQSTNTGRVQLLAPNTTSNYNITFPSSAGTLALSGHTHNNIVSRGNVTAETSTALPAVSGLSMSQAYNNGYPTAYGNVITLKGSGSGQIFVEWSGTSGARGNMWFRNKRDVSDAAWSPWSAVVDSLNYNSIIPQIHSGTSAPASTLGKNGDIFILYS